MKRIEPESIFITSRFGIIDRFKKDREFTKILNILKLRNVKIEIEEHLIPNHLVYPLRVISSEFFIRENYILWAKEFYGDLLVELYTINDPDLIESYEKENKISKDLIVSLILKRSIEGGFTGRESDISVLYMYEEEHIFNSVVKQKRYLIDEEFRYEIDHGDLIHLFQLDFMIHTFKRNKLNPQLASELYSFIGNGLKIIKLNGVLYNLWDALFDTDFNVMTSPEVLNRHLIKYFNMRITDQTSVAHRNIKLKDQ